MTPFQPTFTNTRHFFLVVEADGDGDEYLYSNLFYSNLYDPMATPDQPLAYYRGRLEVLGIRVPEAMFDEIEMDRRMRVGNREVWWRADGSFEEGR